MDIADILTAWRVSNGICQEMLALCSDDDLDLKPGKGKTIRSNFTHLIGFRSHWAAETLPQEAETIPKIDWKTATKAELAEALDLSSAVMERLFEVYDAGKIPGRRTMATFFAYVIAHEAHHRSQIEIALRLAGRDPGDAITYGWWDWSKRAREFTADV